MFNNKFFTHYFIKNELEEVLKYLRVEIRTSQTVTDIPANSNSTVGIL
jgi:hypothetical protein